MHQFSDCDSTDSEDGIRFKTDSTRHKDKNKPKKRENYSRRHGSVERRSSSLKNRRSPSPRHRRRDKKRRKDRSRSKSRSRTKSPSHKSRKHDKHNKKHKTEDKHKSNSEQNTESISFGPALPPHLLNKNKSNGTSSNTESLNSDCNSDKLQQSDILLKPSDIGPATPHSSESQELRSIGPILPSHLRDKLAEEADKQDCDDVYGPIPMDAAQTEAHVALEERALQMKIDQLEPKTSGKIDREEWMVELPQVRAAKLGLESRQFRANPGPDLSDRSSWTDTPEDKAKKLTGKDETTEVDLNKKAELEEIQRRDREQEAVIKAHKKSKKKDKSLLELHQKKLNAKKQEDAEVSVRRPFDREIDLKVNRFDDAQRKAVLKKAQLLDNRFCQGQSKFL